MLFWYLRNLIEHFIKRKDKYRESMKVMEEMVTVHLSEVPDVRRSGCQKVHMSYGPDVRRYTQFIFVNFINGNLTPNLRPDPPHSNWRWVYRNFENSFPLEWYFSHHSWKYIFLSMCIFWWLKFRTCGPSFVHPDLRTSDMESEEIDRFIIYIGDDTDP